MPEIRLSFSEQKYKSSIKIGNKILYGIEYKIV